MWRRALEGAWWRPRPAGLATALRPLAGVYSAALRLRSLAYRLGLRRAQTAPVPVVIIGNMVVGGAGKTPTVIALVHELCALGWTPGVISRGYGGTASIAAEVTPESSAAECGDEPLLIRRRTGVPVWVGRRRVETARALCARHPEVDILVSDDGLQHLALARDAQIVVFDERGSGNGLLLPAGPLREPMVMPRGTQTIVIYNCAEPSTPWPGAVAERRLGGALPLRDWWAGAAATPAGLAALRGQQVLAVAGIAAPERFFRMLETAGLAIDRLPLPDHTGFEPRPWRMSAQPVVVTEKDAVKLPPDSPDADRIHVATLDFRLPEHALDALHHWLEPLRRR